MWRSSVLYIQATGCLMEMGGRPIRGNERLSTSGHSACSSRHVETRRSFEKRENCPQSWKCFFYTVYVQRLRKSDNWFVLHKVYHCIWSFKIRLQRVHDYYPAPSGHLTRGHVLYLLPGAFAIFSPGEELEVFFFFSFGIPIISPEFHHLFSERPILLNWHLNICWPVHYSRHWSPREGFGFF